MTRNQSTRYGWWAGAVFAQAFLFTSPEPASAVDLEKMRAADVIFLGEQHDNPHHHEAQTAFVTELAPKVLVFEMLTPEQAGRITPGLIGDEAALEQALGWEASGWPDFSMYYPIFAAAPEAMIIGAGVPRAQLRDVMGASLSEAFGASDAGRFGLDQPLPSDQQEQRETLQRESHCNALPEDLLPSMVNVQRFRDAMLAKAALDGFETTGGVVVVITGNGHARPDWGAPFLLALAAPDLAIFSLGQGEDGAPPSGGFEHVSDAPSVDRGDPCEAFQ